jgi:lysophospholipase
MQPRLETIEREGCSLALHGWLTDADVRAVVFYVHGTQSHAGWLFETGPALARREVAVYALDRRGSGRSGGSRGDVLSFETWVEDYAAALQLVRARHATVPLTILGQSMGASIAVLLAGRHPELHDAILFSAPALDHQARRSPEWHDKLRTQPGSQLHDITTPLDAFTQDPRLLQWIRDDTLRLLQISTRFVASWVDLETHVRALPEGALVRPCALVRPRVDRIVEAAPAQAVYERLSAGRGITIHLPTEDHFLELSSARRAWLELVSTFVRCGGFAAT